MEQKSTTKRYHWMVFAWTLGIIILDQVSKFYIVANVPLNDFGNPFLSIWNGYLNIIHVRNPAIAFSIGSNMSGLFKLILFKIFPLLILFYISRLVLLDRYMHKVQRICLATILGGGLGNMIDRLFRPLGVVDFVDTDFWNVDIDWGFFQYTMHRWPTYNVADASVLMGMSILIIYTFVFVSKEERNYLLNHIGSKEKKK